MNQIQTKAVVLKLCFVNFMCLRGSSIFQSEHLRPYLFYIFELFLSFHFVGNIPWLKITNTQQTSEKQTNKGLNITVVLKDLLKAGSEEGQS